MTCKLSIKASERWLFTNGGLWGIRAIQKARIEAGFEPIKGKALEQELKSSDSVGLEACLDARRCAGDYRLYEDLVQEAALELVELNNTKGV